MFEGEVRHAGSDANKDGAEQPGFSWYNDLIRSSSAGNKEWYDDRRLAWMVMVVTEIVDQLSVRCFCIDSVRT